MDCIRKIGKYITIWCILCIKSGFVFAQSSLHGTVLNAKSGEAIPYASIGIMGKNIGGLSDSSGSFSIDIARNANLDYFDTVVISSIGYIEKKWLLKEFMSQKIFKLDPREIVLNEVKVAAFRYETIIGSGTKKRNFFSGWSGPGKGGEIGNVIRVDAKEFKLEKLSFYVVTGCEAAYFRLHIREFRNGEPGEELLNGNIILKTTVQDGVSEHDLSKFNIIISDNPQIYISLELFSRSEKILREDLGNNVHITGHKGGVLHYKWFPKTPWLINKDYEMSLMATIKY